MRAGRVAVNAMLVIALLLLGFLAIGPRVLHYRTVTMLSDSMRPTIPAGAMVVDTPEPVSAVRAGQVLTFHAPMPGQPVVTHRVVSVQRRDGATLVRTRGDANEAADPWLAELHGDTGWQVRAVLPYAGDGVRMLRLAQAHWLLLWLVPFVALVWFLVGLWRPRPVEGGDPPCVDPYPSGPAVPAPSVSRSPSPRPARPRSAPSRGRKRRQPARRNSRRRQRRSSRRSRSR